MGRFLPVLVAILAAVLWRWWDRPADFAPRPESVEPASERYRTVISAPRPRRSPPPVEYDRACEGFWDDLRGMDLRRSFQPDQFSLPVVEGCVQVPPLLQPYHHQFQEACRGVAEQASTLKDEDRWREVAGGCYVAAIFYRANLSEWLTQGVDIAGLNDRGLLADKMMAHFLTQPGEAARVAERLLELDPDLYPVAKAALFAHLMEARRTGRGWEAFDQALERAEQLGPEGEGLALAETGVIAAIFRSRDPGSVRDAAEALGDRFPESGLAEYYLAWIEYRQGNPARAVDYLEESCQLRRSARCTDTIRRVKAGEKEAFQSSLDLPLDFLAPKLPR